MSEAIQQLVMSKYGSVATSGLSTDHSGVRAVAEAFGYSLEQLASIPSEANMGLSCGNPTATANLRPGEVVVDLGCGGGLDVFLAASKVGPTGKAIGIDMTTEMLYLARQNAAKGRNGKPITNVSSRFGAIDFGVRANPCHTSRFSASAEFSTSLPRAAAASSASRTPENIQR